MGLQSMGVTKSWTKLSMAESHTLSNDHSFHFFISLFKQWESLKKEKFETQFIQ